MAYVYQITWTELDKTYIGCRIKNKVPFEKDFWINYFTSSKVVANYRSKYGDPDKIELLLESDDLDLVTLKERELIIDLKNNNPEKAINITSGVSSGASYTGKRRDHIISKDGVTQRIYESELEAFVSMGWVLDEVKDPKPGPKGKTMMNNGEVDIYVMPEEIESYLADGYEIGTRLESLRACKGRIVISKGPDHKLIHEEDFHLYESDGWEKGSDYLADLKKGGKWYNDGYKDYYITRDKAPQDGWFEGRIKRTTGNMLNCVNKKTGEHKKMLMKDISGDWEWCRKVVKTTAGTVVMTNQNLDTLKFVDPSEVEKYTLRGYIVGNKIPRDKKRNVYDPKTLEHRIINAAELDQYLIDGWKIGTGKSGSGKNKIWITNGINNKRIPLEQLESYEKEGFRRGKV